ncbi:MAG: hypothetical protein WDN09_00285 [bacterium]
MTMEGNPAPNERGPRVIDTDEKFRYEFADAKNQFFAIGFDLREKGLSLEELQARNRELEYLPFAEYLARRTMALSPQIAADEAYQQAISIHDDLIARVRDFKSVAELEQILEEADEFIREDF